MVRKFNSLSRLTAVHSGSYKPTLQRPTPSDDGRYRQSLKCWRTWSHLRVQL